MPTLLHIDSSPMGEASVSRRLTAEFVRHWRAAYPHGKVLARDLAATPIPTVNAAWVAANYTPAELRTGRQNELLRLSAEFAGELLEADEYILGVPVHNWGPAAAFKLWVDHFVTPFGPKLDGKRATIVIAAGRRYGANSGNRNHVEPWLRTLFGRLGVEDLRFILAEGAAEVLKGHTAMTDFLSPYIAAIAALFPQDVAVAG